MYWSPDHKTRLACTISKRYNAQGVTKYWYAYHPSWDAFLGEGTSSSLALGCIDLDVAFLLPLKVVRAALPYLNVTAKDGGKYWHLKITEPVAGSYFLQVPSPGSDLPISEYQVSIKDEANKTVINN